MQIPDPPIVRGKIKRVHSDTCWIDLEKNLGIGILHQEESLVRNEPKPLEQLNEYKIGKIIKVYIKRSQSRYDGQNKWYVNERWAHDNPWINLKLKKNEEIKGTVVKTAKGGYFIRLDSLDIEAWLPESKVPWSDGSLGYIPNERGIARLSLEVDDRIKAIVTEIHYPPLYPAISICHYLARKARSDEIPEKKQPLKTPLKYSAHIQGDLNEFHKRLAKDKLFTGKQFLIVDDDKLALDALANLLEANGARVKSIHVKSSLEKTSQTIHNLIKHNFFDLILIDYSLPEKDKGLQLACQLSKDVDNQLIILFTGDPLAELSSKHKNCIQSFLRRPLQLDKILACLRGKEYWEIDKTVNIAEQTLTSSDMFDTGKDAFELLNSAVHVYDLFYAVLIKIVTPHRLEVIHQAGHGKFPNEYHQLEHLLVTSDLHQLVKGLKIDLQLSPNVQGNEGLKHYSKWGHFLTLGTIQNPSYILGFGWNQKKTIPLAQNDLWAFALLIQTKLEHKSIQEWLHRQLPFFVQGQLLSGLTHEIRGRFSPWLNYQQALRELWQQYKYSEIDERQALEYSIEEALEGMETAYARLDELMDLLCIATFSSGMLVHSWVRWQILITSDKNNEQNSNNDNFTSIIWPFWLTLSLLSWTVFGQELLWDITAMYSSGNTANSEGTTDFDSGNLGTLAIGGVTIIIAIVTGFYLNMLDSATKHARESEKEIRESAKESAKDVLKNKEKIAELQKEQSDTGRMVQVHLKFLNERFLKPMFDDLQFLLSKVEEDETKQEKIEERIRLIQAEIALFRVIESENREHFLQHWKDIAAYKDNVFNKKDDDGLKKYDYSHLFRLVREHLETLCQECSPKQQEQVAEIKEAIRSYEKQHKVS